MHRINSLLKLTLRQTNREAVRFVIRFEKRGREKSEVLEIKGEIESNKYDFQGTRVVIIRVVYPLGSPSGEEDNCQLIERSLENRHGTDIRRDLDNGYYSRAL